MFIRVAAPALGPIPLMDIRVVLAGTALLAFGLATRRWRPPPTSSFGRFVILGTLNNAIPFTLIATAELHLTASLGAILNATSPFFTVIVAAVWSRRRPGLAQVAGSIIGFGGVVALVGFGPLDLDVATMLAIVASLGGALSYAVAAVYAGRAFQGSPPLDTAIGQLFASGTVLLLPALLTRTTAPASPDVVGSVVALALLGTSLGYLIYFGLIARAGATRAVTVTLLIPVFGVLLGSLVLGDPIGPGLLVGLGLILLGVALVTGVSPGTLRPGERRP